MKKMKWMSGLIALLLLGCGGGGDGGGPMSVDPNGNSTFNTSQLSGVINGMPVEPLNAAETASLPFMREEEKLAQDVYAALDQLYSVNLKTFGNITNSETSHTEAVRLLLTRYSLTDPAAGLAAGSFADANLQTLYTSLVQQGQHSLIDALQVGVQIEELDIRDIQAALLSVDNQDIRYIYDNLMKGSRNHMRSYYKNLLLQGGSYTPQYISQTDFNAIVNSAMER